MTPRQTKDAGGGKAGEGFGGLPPGDPDPQDEGSLSLKDIVRRNTMWVERNVLLRVLARSGGNKAKAARILGIDYKTIYSKIRLYGI